jgi:hypothetical protein
MINDALKNDYGANAVCYSLLSAAVTDHARRAAVHMGGAIDPR